MKRKYRVRAGKRMIEREYGYIPARYIIAGLLTLLEVLIMIGIVVALCYFVPYFYVLCWITQIACVISIVSSDDNPDYKVPWLLTLMVLPIAGFMLYFIFYRRKIGKRQISRIKGLLSLHYKADSSPAFSALAEKSPAAAGQAKALSSSSGGSLFTGTKVTYYPLGEEFWRALLAELNRAERFIYMEYFIVEEGKFFGSILAILERKAKEGVEVKLLYDDIGCMTTLPGNYAKHLKKRGIEGVPFARMRGQADGEFNNRSHRKITVIDGKVGFTGGINLADEYVNEKVRFGHWKDTAVRLEGQAVWELTRLFVTSFGFNAKNARFHKDLYPQAEGLERRAAKGLEKGDAEGYVLPFGDGPNPLFPRRVAKSAIQNLIASATREVYITTPYLIADNGVLTSLENAAIRGVKVHLILPGVPDKKIVFALGRSYYRRLLSAGVHIYEYTPGFVHAKTYLADGETAILGTVNLDYRSLVHHFENGIWMHGCPAVKEIQRDLEETLFQCRKIEKPDVKTRPIKSFFLALGRIFAPLL